MHYRGTRSIPMIPHNGIPPTFPERPLRSRAIPDKTPTDPKDEAAKYVPAEDGWFQRKLHNAKVFQEIYPDHGYEDAGEHEFHNSHVNKPKSAKLFIVPDNPSFLEEESEK
jgi:hypothetical protein